MSADRFYVIRLTVRGAGQFPVDMLRYDRSCPDNQTDSSAITNEDGPVREVHLVQFSRNKCIAQVSIDRWKSFGWVILRAEADGYPIYEDRDEVIDHAKRKRAAKKGP